jgi:hypothetical protein
VRLAIVKDGGPVQVIIDGPRTNLPQDFDVDALILGDAQTTADALNDALANLAKLKAGIEAVQRGEPLTRVSTVLIAEIDIDAADPHAGSKSYTQQEIEDAAFIGAAPTW